MSKIALAFFHIYLYVEYINNFNNAMRAKTFILLAIDWFILQVDESIALKFSRKLIKI